MTSEYITLVGFSCIVGMLRWVAVVLLVSSTIFLFAKHEKIKSFRPGIIALMLTLVATPFLILKTVKATVDPVVEKTTAEIIAEQGSKKPAKPVMSSAVAEPEQMDMSAQESSRTNTVRRMSVFLPVEVVYGDEGGEYIEEEPVRYSLVLKNAEIVSENKDSSFPAGESITIRPIDKPGYSFSKWMSLDDSINDSTASPLTFTMSDGIMAIAAVYVANEYCVGFDANNGNGTMADETMVYDEESALTANAFARAGYDFIHWNTKADDSGDSYDDGAMIKNLATSGNIVLYAIWAPRDDTAYTVVYELMNLDGVGYTIKETIGYAGTTEATVYPTVKEYTGFKKPNVQALTIKGDGSSSITYQYVREKYKLHFTNPEFINSTFVDGGEYFYNAEITLDYVERFGYTFKQWSDGATSAQLKFNITGETTVDPEYEANIFHVVFDANGGEGSMNDQDIVYDATTALAGNEFTKQAYHFAHWNTKADGSGDSYDDGADVLNLAGSGNVDLFAIWVPNDDTPYTVVYELMDLDGTNYSIADTINYAGTTDATIYPEVKSYAGFESPDARPLKIDADGQARLTYQYERKKFNLTLRSTGYIEYKTHDAGEVLYGESVTMRAKQYYPGSEFDKWSNGATDRETTFTMPASDFEIGPEYHGSSALPSVFLITGQCKFNGIIEEGQSSSSNMNKTDPITGDDCRNEQGVYTGQDYINTHVQLFNEENYDKDFVITFDIDEFDTEKNLFRPTLLSSTKEQEYDDEGHHIMYPGIVVRRRDNSGQYMFGSNTTHWVDDTTTERVDTAKKYSSISTIKKFTIARKNGHICYAISRQGSGSTNYGTMNYVHTQPSNPYTFDTELVFGASIEKVGGAWKPIKFMNATLNNIQVRLGKDVTGELDSCHP